MRSDLLHVVTVVANPVRWKSRSRLFRDFARHMLDSGVRLTTVECAYGDIPHQFGDIAGASHVAVQAKTQVWIKENLINIGLARLPRDWKYVAWIDADIAFRKPDWASETVYALQHYDIVQPWADCYDLGPDDEHVQHHRSFCRVFHQEPAHIGKIGPGYTFAHPGYAWAATRSALEHLGGLIDTAALGAADHHMALALVGKAHLSVPGGISVGYLDRIYQWQARAVRHLAGNIGHLPGTIEHRWHGPKQRRRYVSRWDILTKHRFDPDIDLKRNTSGVVELAGNKPDLRRDIAAYFASRNEDANTLE